MVVRFIFSFHFVCQLFLAPSTKKFSPVDLNFLYNIGEHEVLYIPLISVVNHLCGSGFVTPPQILY